MTHAGTNLQISRGIGSNLFGKKEKAANQRQSGPSVGTSGTGETGESERLCEHLCDCDLVIWKTFKGATAGLVSPPCISMFVFVFTTAVSRPGREGRSEGEGRGEQFPACSVGFFPTTTEKGGESGRKRRKENKGTAKADFIRTPLLSIQTN